jgi:N-acetylmuramoyl-L-alanine amidase
VVWWGGVVALIVLAAPVSGRAATLLGVTVTEETPVGLVLHLSAPTVPWARYLPGRDDTPPRVYVDLADTIVAPVIPRELSVDVAPVVRLRTGQFSPTTARVVLDLDRATAFEVRTAGSTVTIDLGVPGDAPDGASDPAPPVVVIDAGHGGHDPGAAGVGGVLEKNVVLQVAHRLAAKLPARLPVDSLLTRSDDTFVPLRRRLPPATAHNAVFVSLHANACDDPRPEGLEIYHAPDPDPAFAPGSRLLAATVTDALRAHFVRVRGRPRAARFTVLAANAAPSILVELGYLTHGPDSERLRSPRYQELLTDALVEGIAAFLQSSEPVASVPRPAG